MIDQTAREPVIAVPRHEDPTLHLVHQALQGQSQALGLLVDRLTPVIQARISRSLLRNRHGLRETDAREYLKDLTQEVFLGLFKNDGETLRRWDPDRGASLENFVGLITERKVISDLRRALGRPANELPETVELVDSSPDSSPERRTDSRHLLQGLVKHFRQHLSPLGWTMFELLFIWEGSVQEVSRDLDMNPEAVRKWRTRLRGSARQWMGKKEAGSKHHG